MKDEKVYFIVEDWDYVDDKDSDTNNVVFKNRESAMTRAKEFMDDEFQQLSHLCGYPVNEDSDDNGYYLECDLGSYHVYVREAYLEN